MKSSAIRDGNVDHKECGIAVEVAAVAANTHPKNKPKTERYEQTNENENENENEHEQNESNCIKNDENEDPLPLQKLSWRQWWDISCLVVAWACTIASVTLVIGTGAVIVQSVGGSSSLAPFTVAAFFLGMSLVSLTCTHWMFTRHGRTLGFYIGALLGCVGSALACVAIFISSPPLFIFSNLWLGAGSGIGMHLRFAAAEVLPTSFHSRAVAWVLTGGCLAAFVGPETAHATRNLIVKHDYLGTMITAGLFYLLHTFFVTLVNFPTKNNINNEANNDKDKDKDRANDSNDNAIRNESSNKQNNNITSLPSILQQKTFWVPVLVAALAWTIMAMPMSIFRLAMKQVGFTDRQSLTVIELHFLGMYAPGFISGSWIKTYGVQKSCLLAIAFFMIATVCNLFAPTADKNDDNNNQQTSSFLLLLPWYLGLIFLGFGWNFSFSSATVWVTKSYQHAPHLKAQVQAANDCGMFLLAGMTIFSTGYIYNAGGRSGLDGWRLLNFGILGFIILVALVLLLEQFFNCHDPQPSTLPVMATNSTCEEIRTGKEGTNLSSEDGQNA